MYARSLWMIVSVLILEELWTNVRIRMGTRKFEYSNDRENSSTVTAHVSTRVTAVEHVQKSHLGTAAVILM